MTTVGDGSVYWLGSDGGVDRFHAGRGCEFKVFASVGSEPSVTAPDSYGSGVYEVAAEVGSVYSAGCVGIPSSWSTGYTVRASGESAEARVEVHASDACPAWSATVVNEKSDVVYVRSGTDVRALLRGDSTVYDGLDGSTASFGFSATRTLAVTVDSPCMPDDDTVPAPTVVDNAFYMAVAWALVLSAYASAVALGAMQNNACHVASVASLLVAQRATRELGGTLFILSSLTAVGVSLVFVLTRSGANRLFGYVTDHSSRDYISAVLVIVIFVSGSSVLAAVEGT